MKELLDRKGVKFLIGIVTVLMLIRWLLTGDLMFAAQVAFSPAPENGKVSSLMTAIWPILFEGGVAIGTAVIAFFSGVWAIVWSVIQQIQGAIKNQGQSSNDQSNAVASVDHDAETYDTVRELARAAQGGNRQGVFTLAGKLRTPELIGMDLVAAARDRDQKRIESLTAELSGRSFMEAA